VENKHQMSMDGEVSMFTNSGIVRKSIRGGSRSIVN
jgi:hypothetical protein